MWEGVSCWLDSNEVMLASYNHFLAVNPFYLWKKQRIIYRSF